MKRILFLFAFLQSTLFLSAAAKNTYYIVTSDTVYGWRLPCTPAYMQINSVMAYYTHNEILYITKISMDGEWNYVKKDKAWVHMSCVRPLSNNEIARYHENLKRHSKPWRTTLWILLALVIAGGAAMFFTDYPLDSLKAYSAIIALGTVSLVVFSYAQFIVCWGLKIVGWIQYYILGGWLINSFTNGILSIIPLITDLPTFGLYGLLAGSIPIWTFHLIEKKFNDFSFSEWVVYIFQIMTLLAILLITNDGWYYGRINSFYPLDSVPGLSFLVEGCDWGEYANTVFLLGYHIGLIPLLFPKVMWKKIHYLNDWIKLHDSWV